MENLQLWVLSWNQGSASDRAHQNDSGPLFNHLASAISSAGAGQTSAPALSRTLQKPQKARGQLWLEGNQATAQGALLNSTNLVLQVNRCSNTLNFFLKKCL